MNKQIKVGVGIIIMILISIASFYIYFATRSSINDIFIKWGIENVWAQVVLVVLGVILIVSLLTMILGRKVNIFKTIKNIFET